MWSKNVGPCVLDYTGAELGETVGGVVLNFSQLTFKSVADKTGSTARGKHVTGEECSVTASLTEVTKEILQKVITGSSLSTGPTKKRLTVKTNVGKDLVEDAGMLILKPIIERVASTDTDDWIYLPKASVAPEFDVPLTIDGQRAWKVVFEGHPLLADDVASGGSPGPGAGFVEGDIWAMSEDAA